MDKEFISAKQCMILIVGFVVGTAIMLVPTSAIAVAKQDAWMAPLLAGVPGIWLVVILVTLNKMFPGKSLVQYSEIILGSFLGKLVSLFIIWFAFHLAALVLRNIGDFVTMAMLFNTPTTVIAVVVMCLAVYALKQGIESITRTINILVPISILFTLMLQIFSLFIADYENLTPILNQGIAPVIRAVIGVTALPVGEVILFSMIIFHIKSSKGTGLYLATGLWIAVVLLVLAVGRAITVLGSEVASRTLFGVLEAVNSGPSSNLVVPILVLNWFVYSISKLFICYYAFVIGITHWLKLPDHRSVVLPAGALITVFSLFLYSSVVEEINFASKIWPLYAIPFEYGIPFLLWVVATIRIKLKKI